MSSELLVGAEKFFFEHEFLLATTGYASEIQLFFLIVPLLWNGLDKTLREFLNDIYLFWNSISAAGVVLVNVNID